ncbi:MAG: 23S rRNA (adenine(2030)-N(6))-methyltransferase RlmJ [Arenimonas sp.]
MNYRHAFHAGNHADVLKHVVLLAMVEAFKRKDAAFYALDTHAGRGRYLLQGEQSDKTGEARAGIFRLLVLGGLPGAVQRYLKRVQADNPVGALIAYPGSPLLIAQSMRPQDRLVACELQPDEARALETLFRHDDRVSTMARDGYAAVKALLPPKEKRGFVLIDPPYEAQEEEFPRILEALADGLARWPTGCFAVWFPIKQRRSLLPFLRKLAKLPCKSVLQAELLVRPDDSPLRLNGSGMVIVNPPYKLDQDLAPALPVLAKLLADGEPDSKLAWLRKEGE